jgi:bacterioferritin
MQGDAQTIKHLNIVPKNELTAINQDLLHSSMFRNWGPNRLQEHDYHGSIEEMKHADKLILERYTQSQILVTQSEGKD